jgi:site-specific recombinase XerD
MKMVDTYQTETKSLAVGPYKATLYRRADVANSSWFFRVYLKQEGRHFRKSLKTDSLHLAEQLAVKEIIEVLARAESGQRILAVSLADLRRRFKLHQEGEVARGERSQNTFDNHGTRLNHAFRFLKDKGKDLQTRVTSLDGEIWDTYLEWRFADAKSRGKTIRRDVVRDELLTIRKMFLFAQKQKLCSERTIPKWSFQVDKEGPRRHRMTARNYTDFLTCIHRWIGEAKNARETYNRLLLRHFVLVISNSGMRSGELFGLKNKDVEVRPKANECLITIRKETSKVRRSRQVSFHASYGGNIKREEPTNYLIRWINDYQIHREPGDFVFSTMGDGQQDVRDVYYHNYKLLRVKLREIGIGWFDTYHCRHFWITNRLLAGESIHLVAKAAGTSVAEIESTYSHVLAEMATKEFNKRQVQYDRENGHEVVETPAVKKQPARKAKRKAK